MKSATLTSEFIQSGVIATAGDEKLTDSVGANLSRGPENHVSPHFASGGFAVASIKL